MCSYPQYNPAGMWLAFLATIDADGVGAGSAGVGNDGGGSTSCGKERAAGTGDGKEGNGSAEEAIVKVTLCDHCLRRWRTTGRLPA